MADSPRGGSRTFETRFAEWVVAARWPIVATSLALVVLAALGGLFLTFSADYRDFFSEDNPELLALEVLQDAYGKSDNVLFMIVPADGDATSEQALTAAVWLTERAWRTPYSIRVDSIANFQHTTADGDDLSVRDLVQPTTLGDAKRRAWVRAIALADPRLVGNLLSRDGSVNAVNVTVALSAEDQAVKVSEIAEFARGLAAEAEERFSGIDIRLVGTVIIGHEFTQASTESLMTFMPVSLAIMALLLFVLTRSIAGVVTTGLVIVFSVVATVGLGGWVGLPLTPTTATAPNIVLMIVVANCVHLLVTLQQRLRAGDSGRAAIVESVRLNLHPVFLASATTALGFLAMNFSEMPPLRHLGTLVAFGVGVSFLLTVTFLPAALSLLPMRAPRAGRDDDPVMEAIADFVIRRRRILLFGSTAVVLALLSAVPRNELDDVLIHFFDESVEFRRDTDFLDERLSGNTVLEYSLASSGPGGVVDPTFLADVSAFAEWFRAQPENPHVTVITDTLRQLNKSMHGDDPDAYRLPESRALAAQYLLLYELSLPFGLSLDNRIDTDRSATRMTVTVKTLSSAGVLALNERAEAWLKTNAPRVAAAEGSGSALIFAHIGQRNIHAVLSGTAVALLGISLILIAALRSLRLGLVSFVPNFVPAVMGFGVWGLAVGKVGFTLSLAVAMTIGIVVDDTVHFLGKYLRARREHGHGPEEAVRYAFRTTGRALFTTTAVLVVGFQILALSPFVPTAQAGMLITAIIGFALVADFLLLPPLLMTLDRRDGGSGADSDGISPQTPIAGESS